MCNAWGIIQYKWSAKVQKAWKAGDTVPKTLNKKMMYIGGKERYYKLAKRSFQWVF